MDSTLWAKAHGGLTHFPIALLVTWRIRAGARSSRPVIPAYLCGLTFAAGCRLAAGYWGGELMIAR
ncbi:MAG TPA: hypothetical protein VGL42_06160 [Opitutaceae bacterium]|jgi:hypothetical protein